MIGVGMNMEYDFFENDLGLGFVFRFWDLGLKSTSIWDLGFSLNLIQFYFLSIYYVRLCVDFIY